jgi:hypothetical protein
MKISKQKLTQIIKEVIFEEEREAEESEAVKELAALLLQRREELAAAQGVDVDKVSAEEAHKDFNQKARDQYHKKNESKQKKINRIIEEETYHVLIANGKVNLSEQELNEAALSWLLKNIKGPALAAALSLAAGAGGYVGSKYGSDEQQPAPAGIEQVADVGGDEVSDDEEEKDKIDPEPERLPHGIEKVHNSKLTKSKTGKAGYYIVVISDTNVILNTNTAAEMKAVKDRINNLENASGDYTTIKTVPLDDAGNKIPQSAGMKASDNAKKFKNIYFAYAK